MPLETSKKVHPVVVWFCAVYAFLGHTVWDIPVIVYKEKLSSRRKRISLHNNFEQRRLEQWVSCPIHGEWWFLHHTASLCL